MTSCQQQFNKIMFSKSITNSSGPPSESQSEISSVDSDWSDIRAIAINLGVQNPDDLLTERFKVDRQKLENMIRSESTVEGFLNSAELFFDNIMKETVTYVSWPCRLKIGAKNKKDPHVRIVGKPECVAKAKEKILNTLDSRGSRVIMKMDVSYTDHSYIIGRCGNNIKGIMEETSTHIHFPDSNRCNQSEKSNQVSLCGSLEGVERARALVRQSTPLLISFELPIMAPGRPVPDPNTIYIKEVETKYNVQVFFSTRTKLHSSLMLVKGSEKDASNVKEATKVLIDYTCGDIANQILVQMQLEISPQHHEVVKGKNNTNLLHIMERTKTKIIFPDVHDMNIKTLKKSQVTINGTIEEVYQAKQQLIGNLPIALIFDYPYSQADTSEIFNLSNKYGVFISLRNKQKQSTMAVIIKGVEKFIDKIYEARHEILQLKTPIVQSEIPELYFSPKDKNLEPGYRRTLTALLSKYPESPSTPGFLMNINHNNNNININNNNINTNLNYANNTMTTPSSAMTNTSNNNNNNNNSGNNSNNNNNTPFNYLLAYNLSPFVQGQQQQQQQQQQHQQHQQQTYQVTPTTGNCTLKTKYHNEINNNCMNNITPVCNNHNNFQRLQHNSHHYHHHNHHNNNNNNNNSNNNNNGNSNNNISANNNNNYLAVPSRISLSPRNSSTNTSGYQSFSSSTASLEQGYPPYPGRCASSGNYSPDSTFNNDGVTSSLSIGNKTLRRLSDGGVQNYLSPTTTEFRSASNFDLKHQNQQTPHTFDFDMKRILGYKAMERQPHGELRTPNANWIGLGLSRTSPAPLETVDDIGMTWNRSNNNYNNSSNNNSNSSNNNITPLASTTTPTIAHDQTPQNHHHNHHQHSHHSSNNRGGSGSGSSNGAGIATNANTSSINAQISPYNLGATTGIVDSTPYSRRMQLSQHKDIHSLLTSLGLEHYIKIFVLNEIDLEMFTSLTEENLTELGIKAFGPRKKLLVAIHTLSAEYELQSSSRMFSGSAAPGAERRSSAW
ncbi:protein bicaudal C [Condylostylus longicornis]|uniref:protein bicaudal C n=1 Tax=Condylostylus longicornis TaxID=2530218 RepID=UPI00244D9DD8|nr:protein bicaudal C [Condylostylus longicornis]XP_055384866.1 protein bicaudal C [Condylostylus longicornis]